MSIGIYGCIPDSPYDKGPNGRDHKFSAVPPDDYVVPDEHDITGAFIPFMVQGGYGTCASHGPIAAWRYERLNNDLPDIPLSRAQLDWDSGVLEGNTADVGRQIRDTVKILATQGIAREALWGYDKVGQKPSPEVYADSSNQKILEYQRVEVNRRAINTAIYMGHPVIIGVPVFKQFESDEAAATGIIRMPAALETEVGWHCMLHGAYNTAWDIAMNWWDDWWGLPEKKSYCKLPTEYIPKLGQDLWTIFMNANKPVAA